VIDTYHDCQAAQPERRAIERFAKAQTGQALPTKGLRAELTIEQGKSARDGAIPLKLGALRSTGKNGQNRNGSEGRKQKKASFKPKCGSVTRHSREGGNPGVTHL
jgi:hypothetical protein